MRAVSFIISILVFTTVVRADDAVPPERPITAEDREHWSYQRLRRPAVPDVGDTSWPKNPVDRFILAKLEENDLSPMPPADRVTLIRRVTFDLTGLPPRPEEVAAFLADDSLGAYERVVDRLLASPAYGERWAQHWLDLARFAETDGFEHDHVRPNAWRYRDWVIQALNDDMPYHEFLALQLAGDEIRPGDPDSAVATGFLLCGPDMPDINLQEERRHTFLNDMTSTVGSVFLAMQYGCAQCHHHKYDPISQHDFYRLRAFFENADLFHEKPIPNPRQLAARQRFNERRAEQWQQAVAAIREFEEEVLNRVRDDQANAELQLSREELQEEFTPEEKKEYTKRAAAFEKVKKMNPPEVPMGRVMRERSNRPDHSYLYVKGDFRREGPRVQPAFPRIVNYGNAKVPPPPVQGNTSRRRMAFAYWLIHPRHPLTTRVITNRLWQFYFGRGLSTSPSDFGIMGDHPTHPELLDWLATELPRRGWSLKKMHRLLVTSATYRQAGKPANSRFTEQQNQIAAERWAKAREHDPDNDLFSRMPRRRLEGEAIRDAMLAASGSLSQRREGPGVRPPLPEELLSTVLKNHWPVTPEEADHNRRSIYLFVRRNLIYPMFKAFDKPDTNASCPKRNETTIAPQALMQLNSELSLTSAKRLCGYLYKHAGDDPRKQIELCYLRTLSRKPTEAERALALEFLKSNRTRLANEGRPREQMALPASLPEDTDPYDAAALTDFCLSVFNLNEFLYID